MKIFIVLLILLYLILIVQCYNKQYTENFGNYYSSCGNIPELLKKVMDEKNIKKNEKDYDFYIPCSYNNCEKDILGFENKADLKNFPLHFVKNKKKRLDQMYVLKNYEQRQEGLKLTRDLNEIIDGLNNGWYLVQDYVYNPYIINKRKINFRYYLLVICRNGNIEGYIHNDGFVYYTPKYYNEYDMDFDKHITTGYIDRKVYDENPLTLTDFRNYLNKKKAGLSKKWDKNAETLMNKVMGAISKKICKNNKLKNNVRFQLFGCDLAPDANLNVTLMEINKGPDLSAKDERDKKVKFNVQKDIFKLVDPDEENKELNDIIKTTNFIKIY